MLVGSGRRHISRKSVMASNGGELTFESRFCGIREHAAWIVDHGWGASITVTSIAREIRDRIDEGTMSVRCLCTLADDLVRFVQCNPGQPAILSAARSIQEKVAALASELR